MSAQRVQKLKKQARQNQDYLPPQRRVPMVQDVAIINAVCKVVFEVGLANTTLQGVQSRLKDPQYQLPRTPSLAVIRSIMNDHCDLQYRRFIPGQAMFFSEVLDACRFQCAFHLAYILTC